VSDVSTTAEASAPKPSLMSDLRALLACPRELWLIFLATFLEYLGVFSFLQTLTLWLSSDYGMSDKAAGYWAATFSTLLTLFVFMVGAIADAAGIRRTLIISFSLAAVTRLGMALAPSPTMAIVALLAFGFAFATSSPVLQAAVQRASSKRTRAFAFTLWYVSFNLAGALCGPLIIDRTRHAFLDATGKLASRTVQLPLIGAREMTANSTIMAWGFVFAVAAAVVISTLRPSFEHRVDPEEGPAPPRKPNPITAMREVISARSFWRFMLLLAFLSVVKMMFQHMHFTWPKYITREQGEAFPVGSVWSLNSLLILGLAPLGTALTRNFKAFDVLLVGAFISALSPLVLVLGSSMALQITMIVVLTIGEALWSPRSYEYTLSIAPRGREATYISLSALPFFCAKLLVGPTSGYLLATFCPKEGPRHASLLWAIIGASTIVGPIGMLVTRGWMARKERAEAA
jgi:MFS family permease